MGFGPFYLSLLPHPRRPAPSPGSQFLKQLPKSSLLDRQASPGTVCPADLPAQKIKAEIGPFIKMSRIVLPPLRNRKIKAFGYSLLDKTAIGKESVSPYLLIT